MGNQVNKSPRPSLLSLEETSFVESSFKTLAGNSEKLQIDELVDSWSSFVDKKFLTHLKTSLGYTNSESQNDITIQPFLEYYYVVVKGSLAEKCHYINTHVFGNPANVEGGITLENLQKFVSSVLRSYFIELNHNATEQYKSWQISDVSVGESVLDKYAEYLLKDLAKSQPITLDELENWMHINPLWLQLWQSVVSFLYGKSTETPVPQNLGAIQPSTLPFCEVPPNTGKFPTILDVGKIMFINDQLPTDHKNKWRLLFNSQIHGESFATFLGKISHEGPTIIVVKDEHDYVFGGFAPEEWSLGPKFVGNDTAMLFKLEPTMQSFMTSGYNNHYQYLNTSQQTMPNGLGMGGQFDYWGLWLDHEYGLGKSSESCTTFKNYVQLSGRKEFYVRYLEVWGVGEKPITEDEGEEHGSVLDFTLEEKSMLELAGVQMHSDGLRDPDLDLCE